ncbi:hypothetical protein [Pantoea agglomerans]|uniref:hypothetical protein n=1 Tax=Enterobacter agglomerans TaxID=549 RepID=UPI0034CDC986
MIIYVDQKNKIVRFISDNDTRLDMIKKEKTLILEIKERIERAKLIVNEDATNWHSQIILYDLEVYLLSCEYNLEKLSNSKL